MNRPATFPVNVQAGDNVVGLSEPSTALDATADLVAGDKFHRGDEAALELLINRILPSLRRFGHRRVTGRTQWLVDIDNLVQDALLSTVRRLPHFVYQTPGALLAYLRRVVVNRIIDAKRKRARQGEWLALQAVRRAASASPLQRVIHQEDPAIPGGAASAEATQSPN